MGCNLVPPFSCGLCKEQRHIPLHLQFLRPGNRDLPFWAKAKRTNLWVASFFTLTVRLTVNLTAPPPPPPPNKKGVCSLPGVCGFVGCSLGCSLVHGPCWTLPWKGSQSIRLFVVQKPTLRPASLHLVVWSRIGGLMVKEGFPVCPPQEAGGSNCSSHQSKPPMGGKLKTAVSLFEVGPCDAGGKPRGHQPLFKLPLEVRDVPRVAAHVVFAFRST